MSVTQGDACNNVKVVVRVRPENSREKAVNFYKVVHVVDKHILVFDPQTEEVGFFRGNKATNQDITKKKRKDLKFVFDAVFDEHATQQEVFEDTRSILDGFLNGYNCTVLAYGATGAGKTHTMLGSPEEPGIMYRTMVNLYNSIDQIKEEKLCSVAVSYLEVYNEQIRDLLTNSGPLAVREDAMKGVVVQGLTLHEPKTAEEILQMLDYGNRNRTQHPTHANDTSSRSHAVFQIYLNQQDKTASINPDVCMAKMCLIDLAGSERASATSARGARFREGTNINRSLLALGNVINALADAKRKKQHIPYRNSKLTRLLKDSLGGNCRTIMIAAVSPSSMFYDDTYNTLKYANRAKEIKSSLKSNVINLDSHITQYVKICEEQKKQIIILKEKLRAYEEREVVAPENSQVSVLPSNRQETENRRFRSILNCVFQKREEIRQEYLRLEMLLKENELKTFYQKQYHKQIAMMCSEESVEKATCKRDHRLAMLKTRRLHMEKKKMEEMQRFGENTNWLRQVQDEIHLQTQNGSIPKDLCNDLQCCQLKLEIKDLKTQVRHVMDLASLQEQQHKRTENVLNSLLPVLRSQFLALKEAGLATAAIESDFKEVQHLVERKKAVVWADQTLAESPKPDLPEISVVMAFPQLGPNPDGMPSDELEEKIPLAISESKIPPQKRTRRKLMASPLGDEDTENSKPSHSNQLDDSLSKELQPIVYTPEMCRTTVSNLCSETVEKQALHASSFQKVNSWNIDANGPLKRIDEIDIPCDRMGCDQEDLRPQFILREDTSKAKRELIEKDDSRTSRNSVLHRLGIPPSFSRNPLPETDEVPSYMAMTSAAQRKRKLMSSAASDALKNVQESGSAKRSRQDAPSRRPLHVNKLTVLRRRQDRSPKGNGKLGRSISEGNLVFASKSRTSKFIKPNFLKYVSKK
ncbi:kinesin-like protein KIF18A [Tachyglossus aculeatus]|uniref:kinesin-like protein KIF18A n=1 Tax=Tachyglossus aculeatus TaxID=9261 RepID=UPI0018F3CB4F|nr:kinesin-like protein KIF18A [Tachyglossus aculeatus]